MVLIRAHRSDLLNMFVAALMQIVYILIRILCCLIKVLLLICFIAAFITDIHVAWWWPHGYDDRQTAFDLHYEWNWKKKQKNHSSSRNECLEKLDAKTKNLKLAEVFSLPNFQIRDPSSIEPAMVWEKFRFRYHLRIYHTYTRNDIL